MRRGFTLIELLVVIAVIAVLVGVLLPALGKARLVGRSTACATRMQQLGVALSAYWNDFDNYMPQASGPLPGGGEAVIGALFGGKKGKLPFYGIDSLGAELRPLNRYVSDVAPPPDAEPGVTPMEPFRSPLDKGATDTGIPIPGFDRTDSMYDLIGASYTLNDHALDGEEVATLVPLGGGKMPAIANASATWALAAHPIYNFQQGGDRGMRWFGEDRVRTTILYVDLHVRGAVEVPEGVVNTTRDYTFLPVAK